MHRECGIGRADANLVMLQGWNIAGKHATLLREEEGVFILPLGGREPITLNGKVVLAKQGPIDGSDEIRIGQYMLKVSGDEARIARQTPAANDGSAARAAEAAASTTEATSAAAPAVPAATDMVVAGPPPSDIATWRTKLHMALVQQMDLRRMDVRSMGDSALRDSTINLIDDILKREFSDLPADINPRRLAKQVLDEAIGLGPLEDLIDDPTVTEIMVNAHDDIFIERAGRIQKSDVVFSNERACLAAIERIVTPLGRRIDESSPLVDARLKDGSRVNAVIPPVALRGPSISIRKFATRRLMGEDLLKYGSLNQAMLDFLIMAVRERRNVVVSGGTGSGKTTLLNILSNFIPDGDRVVTIEDAAELKLVQPNLVALEARPANMEGKGQITIRDLVKNALRMRPDRIVVGECRGGECLDMLQAMNTGHEGSLTTAHANNPRETLSRLEVMVMMAGMELPMAVVREQIASAVNLIVHQRRYPCGSRKVSHITEITGIESGTIQMQDLFLFKPTTYHGPDGKVAGNFVATGAVPEFYEELAERGVSVDLGIFRNQGSAR
ncbi:ATPase, T2SS/T4P/T4SS family [Xanthomonas translucens pv. translucens]|uniref:FHA domain containing protein n=1 Tax=Xanthomonas graminis pv. phlei TaxID=487906 RepID=A0A0K3A3Z1_9XANT|nr:ATPase, T2SS/T4P/T4SS family [Xanthomonas translucens]AVY65065.1 signal peptide protein [Xanthomonas translucens pv. undulosa]MCT8285255.1 ATPase, T2SS/T4P/T4SS family [Xanthomonas translucens pv. translucens]MCT8302913.1 ATPase, T2SS/T4P/T4SS family [Xanthomonas translucens pv. translucens]CTP91174.1 FHA domain containing protein [Xanthomonas translucens pv. phlei]